MVEQEDSSHATVLHLSANFIFKRKYGKFFGMALVISLISHIAFILGMPTINSQINVQQESSMEAIDLPPEVVIPPPPQPLAKPSIPQMAEEEMDEDITIEETTPPPPDLIPEMPDIGQEDKADEFLMVSEVKPKFKVPLPPKPRMPSYIARARVDVTTVIEFFVTKTGDVDPRTKIVVSSGYPELDEIAVEWAKKIKFHPALNRGEPVSVRVRVPVSWQSK